MEKFRTLLDDSENTIALMLEGKMMTTPRRHRKEIKIIKSVRNIWGRKRDDSSIVGVSY